MKKPIKENNKYNFFELMRYIEKKYNINTFDYENKEEHFRNYLKINNINKIPDPTKFLNNINKYETILKEYNNLIDSYKQWCKTSGNKEPKDLSFYDWIYKNYKVTNDTVTITLKNEDKNPNWVNEILNLIRKELNEWIIKLEIIE